MKRAYRRGPLKAAASGWNIYSHIYKRLAVPVCWRGEISVLVRERGALYATLSDKAQAIKAATSSQYGPKSPQYTTIKGLKF